MNNFIKGSDIMQKKHRISGTQTILIGFFLITLIGGILLYLPVSNKSGAAFIDTWFTAVTATCVTGLVTVDTYSAYTKFGHIIILLLIQTGGLGFVSIAAFFSVSMGRRIGLKDRMLISESLSLSETSGVVKLIKFIVSVSLIIELIGAIILSACFIPEFGVMNGIFKGIFHSVSAFCNAGLDLMGEKEPFSSFGAYNLLTLKNVIVNATLCILIVVGGLGFSVWYDILYHKQRKHFRLHTKMVFAMTAVLIILGAVLFAVYEWNNELTFPNMNAGEKIMAAVSQSVFTRTAGFNTIPLSELKDQTVLLECLLMFIGGSAGSTAGGVKTTTFAILILTAFAVIRGQDEVFVWKRRISKRLRLRAFTIIFMSVCIVMAATSFVSISEDMKFQEVLFEMFSAFSTTGLTMGVTTQFSAPSKITVMILMYLGRVGILSAGYAIAKRQHSIESIISYPKEDILM